MNIIVLQLFVGLVLVAGALLLLAWRLRDKDQEHHERLTLMPLELDAGGERESCALRATPAPLSPPAQREKLDEATNSGWPGN